MFKKKKTKRKFNNPSNITSFTYKYRINSDEEAIKDFGSGDYIVLAGKGEEGVFLWVYPQLEVSELTSWCEESDSVDEFGIPNFMPTDPIDILFFLTMM